MPDLIVIGGGLAGCEAAWQAATRGVRVTLYEMRPHDPDRGSRERAIGRAGMLKLAWIEPVDRAPGLLKQELRLLDSLLIRCADESAIPAGGALAVDRDLFAQQVTDAIESHPRIKVIREEIKTIPDCPVIVASGPLTSPRFRGHCTGNRPGTPLFLRCYRCHRNV